MTLTIMKLEPLRRAVYLSKFLPTLPLLQVLITGISPTLW